MASKKKWPVHIPVKGRVQDSWLAAKNKAKKAIEVFIEESSDIRMAEDELISIVKGLCKKIFTEREIRMNVECRARLKALFEKVTILETFNEHYLRIDQESAVSSRFYESVFNASLVSSILPITGIDQDIDRVKDLLKSKINKQHEGFSNPRELGKNMEEEVFWTVNKKMNRKFLKGGMFINRGLLDFVSQPDGVEVYEGTIRSVLEIKVATRARNFNELHRASDTGLSVDPQNGEIRIRTGSKLFQQAQIQMLTTGANLAYIAIFFLQSNYIWTSKIERSEPLICHQIFQASVKLPLIHKIIEEAEREMFFEELNDSIPQSDQSDLFAFGFYIAEKPTRWKWADQYDDDHFEKLLENHIDLETVAQKRDC